ncbi:hypothetical protein AXX16_4473 [Serratia rubidaea]|nr:hypothetical protein AXX16_4473 [Serratia rubidaea]
MSVMMHRLPSEEADKITHARGSAVNESRHTSSCRRVGCA